MVSMLRHLRMVPRRPRCACVHDALVDLAAVAVRRHFYPGHSRGPRRRGRRGAVRADRGRIFPFNIDFVRGAGLLVALAGALAAGPGLLKRNLASLRLAFPVAIIASSARSSAR